MAPRAAVARRARSSCARRALTSARRTARRPRAVEAAAALAATGAAARAGTGARRSLAERRRHDGIVAPHGVVAVHHDHLRRLRRGAGQGRREHGREHDSAVSDPHPLSNVGSARELR